MKLVATPLFMFLASLTATMTGGASAAFAGGYAEGQISIRVSVLSHADTASRSAAKRVSGQRKWPSLCQALSDSDHFKIVTLEGHAAQNAVGPSCEVSREIELSDTRLRSKRRPLAIMVRPV